MGKQKFEEVRFALFTRTFAGYKLAKNAKQSENPDIYIKRLTRALLFREKHLRCFISHKTCYKKFDKIIHVNQDNNEKIRIFLQIEAEMINLAESKQDKESDIFEEYEKALLTPAIERVAGNALVDEDNDWKFERKLIDLRRIYNSWYYKVAYKYRLPTMRIVPFLLRLLILNEQSKIR